MVYRRVLGAIMIAALAPGTAGCGVVAQFAFGWSNEDTRTRKQTHTIAVRSAPPGAAVVRRDASGDRAIGTAPLFDSIDYEQEEVVAVDGWVPMLIVGIVELLVGSAIAVAVPTDETSDEPDTLLAVGGLFIIVGLVDTIWGGVRSADSERVINKRIVGPAEVTYLGTKAGLPSATFAARIPDVSTATLILDPTQVAANGPPPPAPPPPSAPPPKAGKASAETAKWVIAVMDVQDSNAGDRKRRVRRSLVRNLSDQLRIFVARSGVRTIDRGSQDRALKDQLNRIKSESYKQCYDDSCQIELGKALAASHILRSRITKFGQRCVLNGELIDLRAEVTVKAASAQGTCAAEGFLTMCDQVARDLVR